MESERGTTETIVLSVFLLGIVIGIFANELHHESVRLIGIALAFVVLIAAFIFGAWRDRTDNT
jgi:hypothetical protein